MSAYVLSEVRVRDQAVLDRYRALAAASIARHGGRYLARGGRVEMLEGKSDCDLLVVVEFPSVEQARAWYRSPDYAEALTLSRVALHRRLFLVAGV